MKFCTSQLCVSSKTQLVENVEASFGFASHDDTRFFQKKVGNFTTDRLSTEIELHLDIFSLNFQFVHRLNN